MLRAWWRHACLLPSDPHWLRADPGPAARSADGTARAALAPPGRSALASWIAGRLRPSAARGRPGRRAMRQQRHLRRSLSVRGPPDARSRIAVGRAPGGCPRRGWRWCRATASTTSSPRPRCRESSLSSWPTRSPTGRRSQPRHRRSRHDEDAPGRLSRRRPCEVGRLVRQGRVPRDRCRRLQAPGTGRCSSARAADELR
jgi:hypothetical protein